MPRRCRRREDQRRVATRYRPRRRQRPCGIATGTGLGVARNAIIACAALCLVAVGGGHDTTSGAALALQFGNPVFGLCRAPALAGVVACDTVEDNRVGSGSGSGSGLHTCINQPAHEFANGMAHQ